MYNMEYRISMSPPMTYVCQDVAEKYAAICFLA
jgi:hypothetical protein